jgi:four helix bundle protein
MKIDSYRDLQVWQRAMELVAACYKLTEKLPPGEIYGLTASIRRTSVLVSAQIADGKGREALQDYLRYLSSAHGTLMHLETLILLTGQLGYLPDEEIQPVLSLSAQVGKMLHGLSNNLRHGGRPTTETRNLKPGT